MSTPENELMQQFLGLNPRDLLEDLYRVGEDYISDGVDTLEKEVLKICLGTLNAKLPQKSVITGRSESAGSGTQEGQENVTSGDDAVKNEIARGIDVIWEALLRAYEFAGDQFDVFALSNPLRWPNSLPSNVVESVSTTRYSDQDEMALDERIKELEAKLILEKSKKRALSRFISFLNKRIPEAERAYDVVMEAFLRAGLAPPGYIGSSLADANRGGLQHSMESIGMPGVGNVVGDQQPRLLPSGLLASTLAQSNRTYELCEKIQTYINSAGGMSPRSGDAGQAMNEDDGANTEALALFPESLEEQAALLKASRS